MLLKSKGRSLTVRGRSYINVEVYRCNSSGSIFYKAMDSTTGETVYFDHDKNRILA